MICALELNLSLCVSEMKKEGERHTERQTADLGDVGCSANACEFIRIIIKA